VARMVRLPPAVSVADFGIAGGGVAGGSRGTAPRLRNSVALQGDTPSPLAAVAVAWGFGVEDQSLD